MSQQRQYEPSFIKSMIENISVSLRKLAFASRKEETREFRILELEERLVEHRAIVCGLELMLQLERVRLKRGDSPDEGVGIGGSEQSGMYLCRW